MYYAGILLAAFCIWYALSRVGAQVIFRPQKKRWPLKLPFKPVHGKTVTGVYLPAQQDRPTLLFFHGRGGNVSHFESFAQAYAPLGYGILLFDYRGFGLSKATPSERHMQEDAVSAVHLALDTLQISPQRLVLFGHSLGNAPALFAAKYFKDLPLKALILQSPFLSTPDMAASWTIHAYDPKQWKYRFVRAFVTPFLWFNRFDNTQFCTELTWPVLLCSSKQDNTLPWQQSAKLADAIPHVQRFLAAQGGHDEFDWAVQAVDAFLQAR